MKSVTMIPNPSWGNTLNLLQKHGSIRIPTSESGKFKKIIASIGLEFKADDDVKTKLTRFTLLRPTK